MSIVYKCKKCIKEYSTYKSLWRHDALKHKNNVVVKLPEPEKNVVINSPKINDNTICKYCKKKLCDRKYRWKHEQNCKSKNSNDIELLKIEMEKKMEDTEKKAQKEMAEYKEEIAEYKAEMAKLKELLLKSMKIHPKTLQKINNNLNNTNGIINNTVNIVQLGNEDLVNVLTKSEKRGILNRKAMGINDLVQLIHCSGRYKEFMNVYITNLQNTVAYRYDKKINNFIAVNKNELLDEILDSRIYDITKFFNEAEKVLDPVVAADIKRIITKMETDDSFKGLKKEEIKFILYNNKDKIAIQKDQLELDKENELEI